ncbi:MAG: hypothetical protein LBI82_06460 [Dysgonamonadaceae bacterium]|jgi:hypothetical protein|nr:hypothetical protein [Dysgonamonadaceae bacterium]
MEYIEKRGDIYFAKQGDVEIDNKTTFQSRCNFQGVSGAKVRFTINSFEIEWYSNFGYGSWSSSFVSVKYKSMQIRHYPNIDTTTKFVNILNEYVCIQGEEKDKIIVELANVIAHCTNEMNEHGIPIYTSIPIEELKGKSMTNIYFLIKKMKEDISYLQEEGDKLNTK